MIAELDCRAGFVAAAFAVAGASLGCQGAEAPAIQGLRVIEGGVPTSEQTDGTVLERAFSADCVAAETHGPQARGPVVGVAGSTVTLRVTEAACAIVAGAGPTRYRWEIEGTSRNGVSTTDEPARLALRLPDVSGVYRLLIHDATNGGPPLDIELLVTLAAPVGGFATTAAPAAALRAAAEWGAGFGPVTESATVLAQMVERLYEHGRQHWTYGYASKDGNCFAFNGRVVGCADPPGSLEVTCSPQTGCRESGNLCGEDGHCETVDLVCTPGGTMCKCSWEEMLDPDSRCHFSDCFVMSDLLAHTAAALGIDGLRQQTLRGRDGHGFLTHDDLRAFDPEFRGNTDCDTGRCGGYVFSAHEVTFLPDGSGAAGAGTYFDPTFGRVYQTADEPIALNISRQATIPAGPSGTDVPFADSPLRLCQLADGYATWPSFVRQAAETEACPRDPAHPAQLAGAVRLVPLDPDSDGENDGVAVEVVVHLSEPGKYRVGAVLLHAETGARHADVDETAHPASATIEGESGAHTARLEFKDAALDHGHHLRMYAFSQAGRSDAISAAILVPPGANSDAPIALRGVVARGSETVPATGEYTALRVTLELEAALSGAYRLVAALHKDGTSIARAEQAVALAAGTQTVNLTMSGAAIRASGLDTPYALRLRLVDDDGNALDTTHTVCCHAATDFARQASPAR